MSGNIVLYQIADATAPPVGAVAKMLAVTKLVVTSPPYNLRKRYGRSYTDDRTYAEYRGFTRKWLQRLYLAVPDGCRLCLNVPLDTNLSGQRPVAADTTNIAQEVGWRYQSTIVWNEGNISRRTAWGSWKSASAPYVIAPVETIVALYKGASWKRLDSHGPSDITRDEFLNWTNGLWSFNGESAKRVGHPSPFPRELPRRCIKLFSFEGDTICDPFAGSGTTLIEAAVCGRNAIGLDTSRAYRQLYYRRLKALSTGSN